MTDEKKNVEALELAAQCWCDPETEHIEMDTRLATAFANRIERIQAAARRDAYYECHGYLTCALNDDETVDRGMFVAVWNKIAKLAGEEDCQLAQPAQTPSEGERND